MRKVACIGAGLIGQGWATLFSSAGLDVVLQDITAEILDRSMSAIRSNLAFLESRRLMKQGDADAAFARISVTTSISHAVADADYVQESVPDNYDLKQTAFRAMDEAAPSRAILASSASGLLMTQIQKAAARPERCVLVHPIVPVYLIPVVEIAGGDRTSPATVAATCDFMKALGKTPAVLKREVPGYIINRLQAALLREAISLVDNGVATAEDVDRAFCLGIGVRDPIIGPFLRIHLAGGGIERFIENYSRSYQIRWETMESWTQIPASAAAAVIRGVRAMPMVSGRSVGEIERWRDEMLIRILDVLRSG